MSCNRRGLALIVTHVDPTSGVGGAERFVETLMRAYSSCNLLTILIATSGLTRFRIVKRDIGYVLLLPSISISFISLITLSLKALRLALYLLKKAAIVHIVYSESPIELLIGLVARLLKKKVVASPLAFVAWLFHRNRFIRLLAVSITSIKFIITRVANVVHVASLYDKYYVEKVNKNVYLIPHGIVFPSEHVERPKEFKYRFSEKYIIGFLGRFTEAKGALIILDTLYLLRMKYGIDVHLLLIGPKHIVMQSLLRYAKKNPHKYRAIRSFITITGYVNEKKKYDLLKCCNIGIIASSSDPIEAFSYALSEYNVCGIPVVACDTGAVRVRLLPCAGKKVYPCNPENLVTAIVTILMKNKKDVCMLPDVISLEKEQSYWHSLLKEILTA